MLAVMKYFGYTAASFRTDWAKLTDDDKTQLKNGIESESFTY